ncbi:MAG: prepilin peptidase [Actinobacteria bacterium]|nr:prepilin peptidase [Actinomycetota bacterium]
MTALVAAVCAVIGVPVGLFLNVVIDRVPEKEPLRPALPPRRPASGREWWVVVGCVALFAALGFRFGADRAVPAYLVLAASLLAISVIDLKLYIVPNRIVYPTLAIAIPLLIGAALLQHHNDAIKTAAIGSVAAWFFLLVVHFIQPGGMGFGDVRLAAILGLYLGWINLRLVLWGMLAGFVLGAVIGLGLIVFGGRGRKEAVPFAPFLAAGTLLAICFSQQILG